MAVNPTGAAMKAFLADDPDQPVVMLNLLRFADDGRRGYEAYLAHFVPHADAVGASVVYYGRGLHPLVAEEGQAWDAVLLVSYPSRRAFSEMVREPAYQAGTHLRTQALVEAVLQPTVAQPLSPDVHRPAGRRSQS
jgi:uncharacterized protein (DUF1330 family)